MTNELLRSKLVPNYLPKYQPTNISSTPRRAKEAILSETHTALPPVAGELSSMETKMLSITNGEALERALCSDLPPSVRELLHLRRTQLTEDQPEEDLHDLAHFVVAEPGDTAADLEQAINFSIFQNPADGSRVGDPDFAPGWEWIQDHGFAYELCFIMDDSGFGHVVIIPKEQGVDPELLSFCQEYVSEHA